MQLQPEEEDPSPTRRAEVLDQIQDDIRSASPFGLAQVLLIPPDRESEETLDDLDYDPPDHHELDQHIVRWWTTFPHLAGEEIDVRESGGIMEMTMVDAVFLRFRPLLYSLSIQDFVGMAFSHRDAINPEEHLRELLREEQDPSSLPDSFVAREERDAPGWRTMVNDYADAMLRDREWVTFDNGSSYYPVLEMKEALADLNLDEFNMDEDLREILTFWL